MQQIDQQIKDLKSQKQSHHHNMKLLDCRITDISKSRIERWKKATSNPENWNSVTASAWINALKHSSELKGYAKKKK